MTGEDRHPSRSPRGTLHHGWPKPLDWSGHLIVECIGQFSGIRTSEHRGAEQCAASLLRTGSLSGSWGGGRRGPRGRLDVITANLVKVATAVVSRSA